MKLHLPIKLTVLMIVFITNICFAEEIETCGTGSIDVIQDQVVAGELIEIEMRTPNDCPFIDHIRIYKDLTPDILESYLWPIDEMIGGVHLHEQNNVEFGELFHKTADTFNYESGTYYFTTFPAGTEDHVFDSFEVTESPEVVLESQSTSILSLYSERGEFITDVIEGQPIQVLETNQVYILVADLNQLKQIDNKIGVDFWGGVKNKKSDLMMIKIVRDRQMFDVIGLVDECPGTTMLNLADYQDGMAQIKFKTPPHLKYYRNSGELTFKLKAVDFKNVGCSKETFTFKSHLEDSPAHPPIEDFETYNQINFPGESWRNDFPFDTRHIRVVRFGSLGLLDRNSLEEFADLLTSHFSIGTKGYFQLVVDGFSSFPLVQSINRQKVIDWYNEIPKTPEQSILDLNDEDQLYLATLLYYYEHPETEFESDMKSIYPVGSRGEDYTLYVFDGPGTIGIGTGINSSRVKRTRLYPEKVFFQGESDSKTYHFDLSLCDFCGDNVSEYLNYLETEYGSMAQVVNTSIHELGHNLWLSRSGVGSGDNSTNYVPFTSNSVYWDDSIGFFTRFEFMSYGRDRLSLNGMTYGDQLLERILESYARPDASVEFLSHKDVGNQTINVKINEPVEIRLIGQANSGLKSMSYFNVFSPVQLIEGKPEHSGQFLYSTSGSRVKLDSKDVKLVFTHPGTYRYEFHTEDRLNPIPWQQHISEIVRFTIKVAGSRF